MLPRREVTCNSLESENMMKGWRTIGFNVIALVALWAIYQDWIFPPDAREHALGILVGLAGAGNVGLRAVTTTPIGKKDSGDVG